MNNNTLNEISLLSDKISDLIDSLNFSKMDPEEIQDVIDKSIGPIDSILRNKAEDWVEINEPKYQALFEEAIEAGNEYEFEEKNLRIIVMPDRAWGLEEGEFYWHSSTGW